MCVGNLPEYTFVHHVNAYLKSTEAQRGHWTPWNWLQMIADCFMYLSPLEKQLMLLTAEPSQKPPTLSFKWQF